MKRRNSIRSLMATFTVGATFAVVGCGGSVPAGIVEVFASGVMSFTADNDFSGDSTDITDPAIQLEGSGTTTVATLTQDDRVIVATIPTDRPVLGQRFNLHSSSAEVTYQEGSNVWDLSNGLLRFAESEGGSAVFWSGTLSPDTNTMAEGNAEASAIFANTGMESITQEGEFATVYSQLEDGDPTLLFAGDGLGNVSNTGLTLSLSYVAGDQRLIVRWTPSGSPGQTVGGQAEVEFNPDVNGSVGFVEATSGTAHIIYDSNTGRYTASLVDVTVTYEGNTYRFDGFVTGVFPS